ncbi:MAG: hypothetical protein QOJ89_4191 [bacterium]
MNRRTIITLATATALALALPAAAQAHVTVQPDEAPAGGFTRLNVRVPNEEDAKTTTKVVVAMPHGFGEAAYEPVPGWKVKVTKQKAAKPIKTDDGTITEEVAKISFTALPGNGIQPGQFQDFGLSVGLPDGAAGSKLTFKALQYYKGGPVVRWIGASDSEHPAPQVTLTAAAGEQGTTATSTPAATASSATTDDGDFASKGLGIAGLIVGGLGVLIGGAALATRRR